MPRGFWAPRELYSGIKQEKQSGWKRLNVPRYLECKQNIFKVCLFDLLMW